jgi:DNA-binding XRE family transcriptional regulator
MTAAELKKAREKQLKMTQAELAEALGMQRNSITRMEMGIQPIVTTTELAIKYLLAQSRKRGKLK